MTNRTSPLVGSVDALLITFLFAVIPLNIILAKQLGADYTRTQIYSSFFLAAAAALMCAFDIGDYETAHVAFGTLMVIAVYFILVREITLKTTAFAFVVVLLLRGYDKYVPSHYLLPAFAIYVLQKNAELLRGAMKEK